MTANHHTDDQRVRAAVFPVAGLGTRFLPATKTVAKEMLPIVDRPLIQYAVDEAIAAGCDTLVFVTNRHKHAITDYFDTAYELEHRLAKDGKDALLACVRDVVPAHVRTVFVTQPEALGLGHAVLCAQPVVGDAPFAVLLPDDLIVSEGQGALAQMVELASQRNAGVVAVQEVPRDQTGSYGIVDTGDSMADAARIVGIIEKPAPAQAPSTLAVVGRYVLPARIFEVLQALPPGSGGEIQLTDGIAALLDELPMLACRFSGRRFDCGRHLGFVEATIHQALQRPDLADDVRRFMNEALSGQD